MAIFRESEKKSTKKVTSPKKPEVEVKNVDEMIDEAPASHTSSVREYLRRVVKDATKSQNTVVVKTKKGIK